MWFGAELSRNDAVRNSVWLPRESLLSKTTNSKRLLRFFSLFSFDTLESVEMLSTVLESSNTCLDTKLVEVTLLATETRYTATTQLHAHPNSIDRFPGNGILTLEAVCF